MSDDDEWRWEVYSLTEMGRAVTEYEVRSTAGMSGDLDDARSDRSR